MSDFKLEGKGAYIPFADILVVGDLHLGRTKKAEGRAYPVPEYDSIRRELSGLVQSVSPETLVMNGDVFNHFPAPDEAVDLLYGIDDEINGDCNNVVLTVGNHEEKVGGYPDKVREDFEIYSEFVIEGDIDINIFHGHHTPTTPADLFIMNHIHPCVKEGDEMVPCFLFKEEAVYSTDILVLPAFSEFVSGIDVNNPPSNMGHCPVLAKENLSEGKIFTVR